MEFEKLTMILDIESHSNGNYCQIFGKLPCGKELDGYQQLGQEQANSRKCYFFFCLVIF